MVESNIMGHNVFHEIEVVWIPNNHGYPYRARCSCAWESTTYVARHAAQMMGDRHLSNVIASPGS